MVILFVVRKLDVGGMERLVVDLLKSLDGERFTVVVCAIEDVGLLDKQVTDAGVELIHLNKPPGLDWKVPWMLRNVIRDRRIDLIHTHNSTGHFYAALANRLLWRRRPLVHTKHGKGELARPRSVWRNRIASLFSDSIVAVSRDVEKVCHEVEGVPLRKLVTIINGVDVESYALAGCAREPRQNEGMVFGHVGRLSEEKNQGMLLRVFQRFRAEYPTAKLVLVGDGPLRGELEALALEYGISDGVTFAGYRSDVPEVMATFDCFVMSSHTEGTPLVVIEAMAAQCPVIGTDVGGMSDLVQDGSTGFLVPSCDEDAMLRRWRQLAESRDNSRSMGIAGQKRAQANFGLMGMVHSYERLYETLL